MKKILFVLPLLIAHIMFSMEPHGAYSVSLEGVLFDVCNNVPEVPYTVSVYEVSREKNTMHAETTPHTPVMTLLCICSPAGGDDRLAFETREFHVRRGSRCSLVFDAKTYAVHIMDGTITTKVVHGSITNGQARYAARTIKPAS